VSALGEVLGAQHTACVSLVQDLPCPGAAGGIHAGDQCDADRSIGRLVTATNAHTATTISTSTPSMIAPPNAHIQPPALPYRIIAATSIPA
jgi:hypothetical protein